MQHQLTEDQFSELQDLLRRRKKIRAIKLYRKCTGQSLKASKEAVESIANGTPLQENDEPKQSEANLGTGSLSEDVLLQLRSLMEQGKKIDAVKIHREATGESLAKSLQFVESLAAQNTLSANAPNSGMTSNQPPANEPIVSVRKGCGMSAALILIMGTAFLYVCVTQLS